MQNFFPESQKNDTTEKIVSSNTNGFIIAKNSKQQ